MGGKKIIVLIPLYYLSLFINTFFWGGHSYWLGMEGKITFKNLLFHLLFLHGLIPHYTNSIIGGEWYLGILALLYLVAPIIYKYARTITSTVCLFVFSAFVPWIFEIVTNNMLPEMDRYIYSTYVNHFCILAQLPVITLGFFLWCLVNRLSWKEIDGNRTLSYCILILSLIMIIGEMLNKNYLFGTSVVTRYALWFCGIIISQVIYKCKIIDNVFFSKIGQNSWPIFLFHYLVINCLDKIIIIENYNTKIIIKCFATLILSYVLSLFLIKFIDKPFRKQINKYVS